MLSKLWKASQTALLKLLKRRFRIQSAHSASRRIGRFNPASIASGSKLKHLPTAVSETRCRLLLLFAMFVGTRNLLACSFTVTSSKTIFDCDADDKTNKSG